MGALGRSGNGDFELALTIRTFAVAEGRVHLWVGGGIVWDSDPEAEIEESWVKARPLLAARRRAVRAARVTLLAVAVGAAGSSTRRSRSSAPTTRRCSAAARRSRRSGLRRPALRARAAPRPPGRSLPTLGLPPLDEGAAASLVATSPSAVDARLRPAALSHRVELSSQPLGRSRWDRRAARRGLRMHVSRDGRFRRRSLAGAKATSYALRACGAARGGALRAPTTPSSSRSGIVLEAPIVEHRWRRGDAALDPGNRRWRASRCDPGASRGSWPRRASGVA